MSEGTIIGITFAVSYGFVAILLGFYMWYSERKNERFWERLYGKNDKKRSKLKYKKLSENLNKMTELYYFEKHLREQLENKHEVSNLKSCPFCGGVLEKIDEKCDMVGHKKFLIKMSAFCTCGMRFEKTIKTNEIYKNMAINEWNKRNLDK